MTLRVVSAFDRRWTVFWATTYSFELPLFESFLLPRLGEPPLNAVVLTDRHRYASALQALGNDTPWRGSRANRDYVLRGAPITAGAFHPKTYLLANQQRGTLLVGSGNLTMGGLETGKEVFVEFATTDPAGLAAIRTWRSWMESIVERLADGLVRSRWHDAQLRAPWLVGPASESSFVHNWHRPMLNALIDRVEAPVDELHLAAPFFDGSGAAVEALVRAMRPRHIRLLIGRDVSMNGERMREVLAASEADLEIVGIDPETYVHAKLVGVVSGSQGRLLSGSANLSAPAMLRAVETDPMANVEAGVVVDCTPDEVRAAFTPPPPPPGLHVVQRPHDVLAGLQLLGSPEVAFRTHLHAARLRPDAHVELSLSEPASSGLLIATGAHTVALVGTISAEPMADARLVWLVDGTGLQQSNKVAVDDPHHLDAALVERGATDAAGKPDGLQPADLDTPVGQMLARLHAGCIFDFDETPTAARLRRTADAEDEDPDHWARLAGEDLRRDPRVAHYQRLGTTPLALDGLFLDLARMRDMVPSPSGDPKAVDLGVSGGPDRGPAWTPDRRLETRLFNVLDRWSTALSDPRLLWASPSVPIGNFAALLGALRECWAEGFLPPHRVTRLVGTLLTAFLRGERRGGFLASLTPDQEDAALGLIRESASPAVAAALTYACVRPSQRDLLGFLFSWQPALTMALALGVLRADADTEDVVEELLGERIAADKVSERLHWAASHVNDERWSELLAAELGLRVQLLSKAFSDQIGAVVAVDQGVDLRTDPRVLDIVRRAMKYRGTAACVVEAGTDRLIIELGETAGLRRDGRTVESEEVVTADLLDRLADDGGAAGSLLGADVTAA